VIDMAWQDQWRPLMDAVGSDLSEGDIVVGPDVVERGAIRRFVEVLELGCPLHVDPDVAAAHGHPEVVAPVSSITTFTIAPLWSPGDPPVFTRDDRNAQPARSGVAPRRTGLEPETTGGFATDLEADFLRPVHAGMRLTRAGYRLVACTPKETRVGRGAFVTWESETRDESDTVVARWRSTGYRYTPHALGDGPVDVEGSVPSDVPPVVPPPTTEPVDWSRQRTWRELDVGMDLQPVAFPLSVYRLVVAAGANRDFNSIHHNSEWAKATGAPEMYANVLFLQGMWERCVRELIGNAGTIRAFAGFRMRSFNTAGDTVVVRGTVADKWERDGEGWAKITMWSENRHGTSVGPGTVTVTMPMS
jgi:acyl dehydratase